MTETSATHTPTMTRDERLLTIVLTIRTDQPTENFQHVIEGFLHGMGAELVPCGWAPDPDTIADQTDPIGDEDLHRVEILDLNPGRYPVVVFDDEHRDFHIRHGMPLRFYGACGRCAALLG